MLKTRDIEGSLLLKVIKLAKTLSIVTNSAFISYNTVQHSYMYVGNFSIREKTVNLQLGMGPITRPACKEYYALNDTY